MSQYNCKGCGTELNALNMSDDEEYCKACFDKIVAGMDTNDESTETKFIKDRELDEIIASPCPQIHMRLPHIQKHDYFHSTSE